MKKIVLLLVSMFWLLGFNVFAEQKVGTYRVLERDFDIEAGYDSNNRLVVYIGVISEYDHEKSMIAITGENNVESFVSALQQVKAKYNEWKDVAIKNNVTDYKKAIDVTFPNVEIYWRGASKWYSSFSRNFIKMLFLVSEEGKATVGCGGEAKDWDNEYITQKWYFLFSSSNEIEGLVKALNIEGIKSKISSKQNTDDLFN